MSRWHVIPNPDTGNPLALDLDRVDWLSIDQVAEPCGLIIAHLGGHPNNMIGLSRPATVEQRTEHFMIWLGLIENAGPVCCPTCKHAIDQHGTDGCAFEDGCIRSFAEFGIDGPKGF